MQQQQHVNDGDSATDGKSLMQCGLKSKPDKSILFLTCNVFQHRCYHPDTDCSKYFFLSVIPRHNMYYDSFVFLMFCGHCDSCNYVKHYPILIDDTRVPVTHFTIHLDCADSTDDMFCYISLVLTLFLGATYKCSY